MRPLSPFLETDQRSISKIKCNLPNSVHQVLLLLNWFTKYFFNKWIPIGTRIMITMVNGIVVNYNSMNKKRYYQRTAGVWKCVTMFTYLFLRFYNILRRLSILTWVPCIECLMVFTFAHEFHVSYINTIFLSLRYNIDSWLSMF